MLELNKIYNEDCIGENGMCLIPDKSIDMVLTDPPYGIGYENWDIKHDNHNSAYMGQSPAQKGKSTFKHRGKPINGWSQEDRKIPYEYEKWCDNWIRELFRVTKQGSPILIFSSRRLIHRLMCSLENNGFCIKDVLIWKKQKGVTRAQRISHVLKKRNINIELYQNYRIGNLRPDYEPIIYAFKPYKGTITDCVLNNSVGGFNAFDGVPSNIFEYPSVKNGTHPTEKPTELLDELIKIFTLNNKQVILDPFMGSGTTAIACLNTNRKFIGFELDKQYYDIANERIKNNMNN